MCLYAHCTHSKLWGEVTSTSPIHWSSAPEFLTLKLLDQPFWLCRLAARSSNWDRGWSPLDFYI